MKFKVVYRSEGRLRIRFGSGRFSRGQGFTLGKILMKKPGISNVVTCHLNGSVLILYEEDIENALLVYLENIDFSEIEETEPDDFQVVAEADSRYITRLINMVTVRYFCKWFLPMPISRAITLFKARSFIKNGVKSLMKGKVDVAVIDASSIGASLLQGEFNTANSIMFLLSVSELLEEYTKERAKIALTENLRINVDSVWCVRNGKEEKLPMSDIVIGDVVMVRTGSMIPVDGTVVSGECTINESSMTGESIPVDKREGSTVYAGTVIEDGNVHIEVKALPKDSRINKIVDFVEGSEKFKADIQSKAESLADAIVPFSFIGAALVFILTGNWRKAVSVLMVDYSCAIKLATPISVISAIKEASSKSIMVKGGKYLELLSQADTVVFDKTGTLTSAEPKLCKVFAFGNYSEREVLKISACIEEHFPHSVARAIVNGAAERGIDHKEEHADVEYVVAHGIVTKLNGERAIIGSAHFLFDDMGIVLSEEEKRTLSEIQENYSCVYLGLGDRLAGCLCIEDPPRIEAREVISELRNYGINEVIMLTGDGKKAARAVAEQLGIETYKSEVLPDEKAAIIQQLKEERKKIIMVGDGINDSPALASAHVSVAMRDASDIAREVADITLLSSDLNKLVDLMSLSKKLLRRINRNYRFIVSFNSALLLSGLGGIITPVTSATLHNLSTMGISLHSMRPLLGECPSEEDVLPDFEN